MSTVNLTWTPAPNAASHQPQYRAQGAATWNNFGSPLGASAGSVAVTGLSAGTVYEFRIRANGSNTSPLETYSTIATATTASAGAETISTSGSTYTLTQPAGGDGPTAGGSLVSINIFGADGVKVRTLLQTEKQLYGTHDVNVLWDKRNDAGALVPTGTYSAQIAATQGIVTQYEGLNVGSAMIAGHPRVAMPGNHNGVAAAAVVGGRIYLTSSEGEATVNQLALDSTTYAPAWSAYNHTWLGGTALAVGKGWLWALHQNGNIGPTPLNLTTLDVQRDQSFYTDVYADRDAAEHAPFFFKDGFILDMDGREVGGVLNIAVSYTKRNRVRFWDQNTTAGNEHLLVYSGVEVAVTAPTGLTMAPNGDTYTITQGRVVRFSRTAPTPVEVIPASALNNPWRLAWATDGTLLVLEASKWAQWAQLPAGSADPNEAPHYRVRRFSAAGAFLSDYATTRKLGGAYAPTNGLFGTFNIAADEAGGFIVTEPFHAPRKTARHNADGTIKKVWHGPNVYSNAVFPDAVHADRYWMATSFGELTEIVVDHAADTWAPHAVYPHAGILGIVPQFDPHNTEPIKSLERNGKRYVCIQSNLQLFQLDEAGGRLLPLAVGFLSKGGVTAQESAWGITAFGQAYIWTATSPGDFSTDISRVRKSAEFNADGTRKTVQAHARYTMNSDFSLSWVDRYGSPNNRVARMVPTWDANGVPVYPIWDAATEYYGPIPNTTAADIYAGSVQGPFDGKLYVSMGGPLSGRNTTYYLTCIRVSDNKVLWQVGKADPNAQSDANGVNTANGTTALDDGDVVQSMRLAPMDAYGNVIHIDMDSPAQIWDKNGLWIGRLFEFKDTTQDAGVFKVANQMHGGTIQMTGAEVRIIPAAYNTAPLYRLKGLDRVRKGAATVTV